jgi:NADPH:quinone reductase-like Zn-dependent oxidoreductase
MKAIIYEEYGPPEVFRLKEIEKPVLKDNEILIKITATSVNYGDLVARNFKNITPASFNMPLLFWLIAKIDFGISKPKHKILGSEFAGEVYTVGKTVKLFKPGDEVFGYLGSKMGAYQEFLCIPENSCITLKPVNMNYEESAVIPYGSIMAYGLLKNLKIKSADRVLIIGASGSIGSAAVQIAKNSGAYVTGVCGSNRTGFVKSIGADKIINYEKEDYTTIDDKFDLIFDVLGKSSIQKCKKILKPGGIHFFVSFKSKMLFHMLFTSIFRNKRVKCSIAPGSVEDLKSIKKIIEEGKLKSIIDQSFSMEQIAEAHSYVESNNKKANVVISFNEVKT